MKKLHVGLIFGGRSVEHEISIITALQAALAIDRSRFELHPIYIDLEGRWFTGEALLDKRVYPLNQSCHKSESGIQSVTILPQPGIGGLTDLDSKQVIPLDTCLICCHGQYGEDGCLQGLLELADIPYTCGGVTSCAVSMDKALCKAVMSQHGIPTLPCRVVRKSAAQQGLSKVIEQILDTPGLGEYPLFVKPCHLGSSIGIGKASDDATLAACLAKAFQYDDAAIVEPCVQQMLEINVSVVGTSPLAVSVTEVPVPSDEALSYSDKYLRKNSKTGGDSEGMASLTRVIDSQDLDPKYKQQVIQYATCGYEALNCKGVVRFDFMLDTQLDRLYFNELNMIPGSLSYYLWEKTPVDGDPHLLYTHLLDALIYASLERKSEAKSLDLQFGFKALNH